MDRKTIIGNAITAVVTAVVMGVLASVLGILNAGNIALDEAQIEKVINRIMILDDGESYGATLSSINIHLGSIDTSLGHIQGDIQRIDSAVGALATE